MLSVFILTQLMPLIIFLAFILQQNHLLISLLSLEGVTLSLVLIIPLTLTINIMPVAISCLILLTLGACEASLGLALIVAAARATGNYIINTLSINKC